MVRLNGATKFSKLDMIGAYTQCKLTPESRYITGFIAPSGAYQFKRLNFGINTASELFQKTMENVLANLNGCMNFSDDINIWGNSDSEHDTNLDAALNRLENAGITLNGPKCLFSTRCLEIVYSILK